MALHQIITLTLNRNPNHAHTPNPYLAHTHNPNLGHNPNPNPNPNPKSRPNRNPNPYPNCSFPYTLNLCGGCPPEWGLWQVWSQPAVGEGPTLAVALALALALALTLS